MSETTKAIKATKENKTIKTAKTTKATKTVKPVKTTQKIFVVVRTDNCFAGAVDVFKSYEEGKACVANIFMMQIEYISKQNFILNSCHFDNAYFYISYCDPTKPSGAGDNNIRCHLDEFEI